jgi:hypothetical protein
MPENRCGNRSKPLCSGTSADVALGVGFAASLDQGGLYAIGDFSPKHAGASRFPHSD